MVDATVVVGLGLTLMPSALIQPLSRSVPILFTRMLGVRMPGSLLTMQKGAKA